MDEALGQGGNQRCAKKLVFDRPGEVAKPGEAGSEIRLDDRLAEGDLQQAIEQIAAGRHCSGAVCVSRPERNTRPGSAPVCALSRTISRPLTITWPTPVASA